MFFKNNDKNSLLARINCSISYEKFVSHRITLHFAVNFTLVIICCCRSLSPQVPHTYHNPTLMASPYSTLPRRPTSSSSGASSANRGQPQQPHHDLRGCPPPIMASAVGRNSPLLELTGMYVFITVRELSQITFAYFGIF